MHRNSIPLATMPFTEKLEAIEALWADLPRTLQPKQRDLWRDVIVVFDKYLKGAEAP